MNHRERVIHSIQHEKVDRVPFNFWAEKPTLEKLYSFYGTRDLGKILKGFEVDIRHLEARVPSEVDCGDFIQNFWGERYIYRDTKWGPMLEDIPGALSNAKNMNDLENFDCPRENLFKSKLKHVIICSIE